jgi:signal transduction histidine kinase
MIGITQTRVVTMQYSVVVLLVIISFWAAKAFKENAFRIIALAWLSNLFYLFTSDSSTWLGEYFSLRPSHLGAPAEVFDLSATTLFWFAAHKWGKKRYRLYFSEWPHSLFLTVPVGLYLLSILSVHVMPQSRYSAFLAASLPMVLADTLAIATLAIFFRELALRTDNVVPNKGGLLFTGTLLYATIQTLQLLAYGEFAIAALTLGFFLGLAAKILIFLGIIRLLVASAESLTKVLAEQEQAKELTTAIDLLAHELGTPIGEIKVCVDGLGKGRNQDATFLKSIESAASRAAAILQASKFAVNPSDPHRAFHRRGETWLSEDLHKSQAISVNTVIELAQSAVKSTRPRTNVIYSHHYAGSCCVQCVPSDIVQVLINILRNSYDAIDKAGIQGKIDIRSFNEKTGLGNDEHSGRGTVRVIVRDNGEGIGEDKQPRIFEQGYSTRGGRGRGFGLVVSKGLVEKNFGCIVVNSPPKYSSHSTGTEVVLLFPRVDCTH